MFLLKVFENLGLFSPRTDVHDFKIGDRVVMVGGAVALGGPETAKRDASRRKVVRIRSLNGYS
jgi:hypothetical protein